MRECAVPFPAVQPHPRKERLFSLPHTNKLGVTLDIARPEVRDLERLVAQANVLINNVAPLEMDRSIEF